MSWMETVSWSELAQKGSLVFRRGSRQIALWNVEGRVYALNNRCPHEGYPLHEGTINLKDCLLTCNWHNWKFDLATGANIVGEDHVVAYRTKIEKDKVLIEIPDVTEAEMMKKILGDFQEAFTNQQYGRMARELARLHFHGLDPVTSVKKAIEWSHDKLEFGMDHAYAVSADWLTLYRERTSIEDQIACLLESVDYMSETSLRQPTFPYTEGKLAFSHERFLEMVEKEDEETAIALIRGALAGGLHFADLERTLTASALTHYNDFGHSLIYTTKVGILVHEMGAEMEPFLLPALVRSICLATREDLLREFRSYSKFLSQWPDHETTIPENTPLKAEELYGKSTEYCLEWTVRMSRTHSYAQVFQALLHANARSLLHYDMEYQFSYINPVSKNIGWLDFTHGLTFANAVRQQCSKFPELWKYGLLQMACFLGRNSAFLSTNIVDEDWAVKDQEAFLRETLDQLLDHGKGMPIYAAHYLKTFLAVRKEIAIADSECARDLLASFNRYLKSPLKEKHVRRTVRQSLGLVSKDFEV